MTSWVTTEPRGAVALVTIARPPVNSLSQPAREALWTALEAADADDAVRAIVLTGAGRGFCAGGELSELSSPLQQAWPGISNHLLPRIEACSKPVIAALHGFAIGGGLELALACHARVARRGTRIALPEIRHGALPPSGSQRMPRAVGVRRALDLIVGGDTVLAEHYTDSLLFDRLCDGDPVAEALALSAALDPMRTPPALLLLRHRTLASPEADEALAYWRARLVETDAGPVAARCVDAVEAAVRAADFDTGLCLSKRLHDDLVEARWAAAAQAASQGTVA